MQRGINILTEKEKSSKKNK